MKTSRAAQGAQERAEQAHILSRALPKVPRSSTQRGTRFRHMVLGETDAAWEKSHRAASLACTCSLTYTRKPASRNPRRGLQAVLAVLWSKTSSEGPKHAGLVTRL